LRETIDVRAGEAAIAVDAITLNRIATTHRLMRTLRLRDALRRTCSLPIGDADGDTEANDVIALAPSPDVGVCGRILRFELKPRAPRLYRLGLSGHGFAAQAALRRA
jgi:hypothetical protein